MDPKLAYWTCAFLNMLAIVGIAARGVTYARRHEIAAHRRCMSSAAALVGLFIASYLVKIAVLGREDLSGWERSAVATLRVHELCVLVMLLGGCAAGLRAWRMRAWIDARPGSVVRAGSALGPGSVVSADAPADLRAHRRAGWTAVMAALLGVVTAAAVLAGMFARADGS